jgi:pimeloyl-ACP methyl ester carboxylesterase
MRVARFLFGALLSLFACSNPVRAGEVHWVRNGERQVDVFWQPVSGAKATLLMFSGGDGGFGTVVDGRPGSGNFLVRTLDLWTAKGFNVAYFGDLHADRYSSRHVEDIRAVLGWIEENSTAPIFLVGTSRGTISAAYAAVNIPDEHVQGLVLTSTMQELVSFRGLADLKLPVLDLSNRYDSCRSTSPGAGPALIAALKMSPRKEFAEVSGGNSLGDPCQAMAYHGFHGIESEVVDRIAAWLLMP